MIDDIQSLGGKKVTTQEEFFNTFNALHSDNKQIVLTSDRSPDHLDSLEERLVTRFKWGLTQNITPPDFETRIAILRNKIEDLDYIFPNDTLEYLAGQFDSNVRDLEGALNDISLMAKVKKLKEITIDVAAEAIRARKTIIARRLSSPLKNSGSSWSLLWSQCKRNQRFSKSSEYCPSTTSGHVSFKRDDGQLTSSNRKRIRWKRPHDCHSCL